MELTQAKLKALPTRYKGVRQDQPLGETSPRDDTRKGAPATSPGRWEEAVATLADGGPRGKGLQGESAHTHGGAVFAGKPRRGNQQVLPAHHGRSLVTGLLKRREPNEWKGGCGRGGG